VVTHQTAYFKIIAASETKYYKVCRLKKGEESAREGKEGWFWDAGRRLGDLWWKNNDKSIFYSDFCYITSELIKFSNYTNKIDPPFFGSDNQHTSPTVGR
jgi:hypothetical protein